MLESSRKDTRRCKDGQNHLLKFKSKEATAALHWWLADAGNLSAVEDCRPSTRWSYYSQYLTDDTTSNILKVMTQYLHCFFKIYSLMLKIARQCFGRLVTMFAFHQPDYSTLNSSPDSKYTFLCLYRQTLPFELQLLEEAPPAHNLKNNCWCSLSPKFWWWPHWPPPCWMTTWVYVKVPVASQCVFNVVDSRDANIVFVLNLT